LSNLETEKRKLLQLVLLGQPDLDSKLARPEIRQLLQRITFSEYLGPLGKGMEGDYLRHRLARAARDESTDLDVFTRPAVRALAQASGGVPRLLNIMAHKCLMLAYGEGVHRVSAKHVKLVVKDTPGVAKPRSWRDRWASLWGRKPRTAAATKTAGEVYE